MTIALGVGVAALAITSFVVVDRGLSADIDRSLLRETEAYTAAVTSADTATGTANLVDVSRQYLEARTAVSTASHPILALRLTGGRTLSNSDVRIELAEGNRRLPAPGFSTVSLDGEEFRIATATVLDATGNQVGVFQAALSTGYARGVAADLGVTLALAGVAVVAIGAILSARVARASLSPLRNVAETAERISHTSLADRVPYDGPRDEVGALVASFNSMLDRLETAFGEQRRFVADASHELRTPLAVVQGNLDLIAHPNTTAEEKTAALEAMREETRRLERLVNDLLALARLDSGTRRPFQLLDVATLLEETAGRTRALGDRSVGVHAPESVWVLGDPDLLEQALMNLTRNAVGHTQDGGNIDLVAVAEGDSVRVSVADDGPGLRPEDVTRVFDRFYRAHGPRNALSGGSGLGLAITRRLIELHGGSVEAANRPGGGAEFTVCLPRKAAPKD